MSSIDEKELINGLFDRLEQAENQSGERDGNASQLIKSRIQQQPAAPYYMAQTILIQEAALKRLNERVERLEQQVQQNQRSSGGFLSGLFGGGNNQASSNRQGSGWNQRQAQPGWGSQNAQPQAQPQMGAPMGGGRSFLSGALQTATGVAGGMVMGNMLTHMFSGHSGEDIVGGDASNLSQDSFDQGYEDGMMDAHQDGLDAPDQGFGNDQGMPDNGGGIDDFGGGDFDDFGGDDF